MNSTSTTPKFDVGRVFITPGALNALKEARQGYFTFLARHVSGDWGEVNTEDWRANDAALRHGLRLLSSYRTAKNVKLWIITEADRSITTILLPEEY